ncbi:MAG: DUF4835 family protein [Bacteroidales bacterium]|jgi:hypothetical protein|nr:DUF4835 family protein [Bacteroidales bacterium]
MKKFFILFICLLFACFIGRAEEFDCTLKVTVSSQINIANKKVFEQLERALTFFVNGRKWTTLSFKPSEKIICNIVIDVQKYDLQRGVMDCYLSVQLRRPVFKSSYSTTILNTIDRDYSFHYVENDPIEYSDENIGTNLTATISYYCYLMLGLYFDSFGYRAGENFFDAARNVVNLAQSFSEKGWKAIETNNRNRYNTVESYANGNYSAIHEVLYAYYRQGLDNMYEDPAIAREAIIEALQALKKLDEQRSNLPSKLSFIEAKSEEIVNIFKEASPAEKKTAGDLLKALDPAGSNKYNF